MTNKTLTVPAQPSHNTLKTLPPVQIRHTQLARGARNQQNLEVNEHAVDVMLACDASSTSPLVLTHVVVHLGRCC